MSLQKKLAGAILETPSVTEKKSRFSSNVAFFIGTREFAHFHSANAIHIRLTKSTIRKLELKAQDDTRLKLSSSSDWVEFTFRRASDLDRAVELVHAAYESNQ